MLQVETYQAFGASAGEAEELCRYDERVYGLDVARKTSLPLADEPFVAVWESWLAEAEASADAPLTALASHLPQLRFPVEEGMSQNAAYRRATLSGVDAGTLPEATGLHFSRPEAVELKIYNSFAGRIPLLISRQREAFVTLVRALARRNEPVDVPDSQGASMVSGLANWERIRAHRAAWEARPENEREAATWPEEFARLRQRPESYRDRFILLSDGPYSAVPADALGLDEDRWREISLIIRREHECTHYLTRRVFGTMRNHLLDELIADYTGMVAAVGAFRADWFLRFLGLEDFPHCRDDGRIGIYRGKPPLSDGAFAVLQAVVKAAAENLERFDREYFTDGQDRSTESRGQMILALATASLAGLAFEGWRERIEGALASIG